MAPGRCIAFRTELDALPPTHVVHTDVLMPFTEKVAEVTEGRVTVTILPAPLGSPPQHWELARTGAADIAGETLSAAWGRNFDVQNPAATEKLAAAGNRIVEASPELIAAVDAVNEQMTADWIDAAKAAGVEDPAALLAFYHDTYKALAGE